jgi:YHS domain-containing protein
MMKHSSKTVFFGLALILMVLFVASQIQAEDLVNCAVSGKEIKKSEAKGSMEYNGKTYYFCCDNCQDSFVARPITSAVITARTLSSRTQRNTSIQNRASITNTVNTLNTVNMPKTA